MKIKNKITNSFPSIIHSPDENDLWKKITTYFLKKNKTKKPFSKNKNATIISWCNFEESFLKKSSELIGEEVFFYGKNDNPWFNLNKFKYNLEALDTFPTKYFIGLDALDVIIIDSLEEIVEKFEKMSCSLLFNCESVFYPPFYDFNYYLDNKNFQDSIGKGNFKYLNSGAWIGKKDFCRDFFNTCNNLRINDFLDCGNICKLENCDQSIVHYVFKKYYPDVKLDYDNQIFSNISRCVSSNFSIDDEMSFL